MASKSLGVVTLSESLDIRSVEEIKNEVSNLLAKKKKLHLDFSSISTIDISGFQLLVSLILEEKKSGVDVSFIGSFNGEFKKELNRTIFTTDNISDGPGLYNFIKEIL